MSHRAVVRGRRLERAAFAGLLALAAIGCRSSAREQPAAPEPAPDDARASGDAAVRAPASPIPAAARQLVVGLSRDWSTDRIELARYERAGASDPWKAVGESSAATIGAAGMAWGIGLHGAGAPDGMSGPAKAEGDRKSPAGAFELGAAFGYDPRPPDGTRIDYLALDGSWRCVDDATSSRYNRVFSARGVARDWSSAERMRRRDELYRRGILIDHNRIAVGEGGEAPEPGAGSCIFFHVWRDSESPTVGCAALPRERLEALITWLDPDARPVLVLLPDPAHRALAGPWGLPAPGKK